MDRRQQGTFVAWSCKPHSGTRRRRCDDYPVPTWQYPNYRAPVGLPVPSNHVVQCAIELWRDDVHYTPPGLDGIATVAVSGQGRPPLQLAMLRGPRPVLTHRQWIGKYYPPTQRQPQGRHVDQSRNPLAYFKWVSILVQ